ncbi:MAG: hypothetical protein AB1497_02440 [Bacillota bacterium]
MDRLTERECLELSDHIGQHQVILEKLGHYINECDDQEVRQALQRHQNIYNSQLQRLTAVVRNVDVPHQGYRTQ